jgi:hypothetical protein
LIERILTIYGAKRFLLNIWDVILTEKHLSAQQERDAPFEEIAAGVVVSVASSGGTACHKVPAANKPTTTTLKRHTEVIELTPDSHMGAN